MKRWKFRSSSGGGPPLDWADKLSISTIMLKILWQRGFQSLSSMENYLSTSLRNLTPPGKWPLVSDAAKIIASDLIAGKKMAVWGDYDVDGITATTLVLDILEFHGFKLLYHLPDRLTEGYGVNTKYIEELARQGCQTLVTVDCGISNIEAIKRANELGITVVVCDHHLPPPILPNAKAFVNPKIESAGKWPCTNLSGVGVAFYVMAEVNRLLSKYTNKRYYMDDVLDLVALGTLADVMDLEGENRILVRAGLNKLSGPKRAGIAALKLVSGFDLGASLNSNQAVFRLAPRINAAGRMGNPQMALDLLRSNDFSEATSLAKELDNYNSHRKSEEARIHREARIQAQSLLDLHDYHALVLCGSDWHPGIVGIVASRIVEEFNRPAVVLYEEAGILKGSGRSVINFDLYAGLDASKAYLTGFGGHNQAAGVSLQADNLENFRKIFSDVAKQSLGETKSIPELLLDGELGFKYASDLDFVKELDLMQPLGSGNPEPVFASLPVIVKEYRLLGQTGEHILLNLCEADSGRELKAKGWRMANQITRDLVNKEIRIAFTPEIDVYNGMTNICLLIKDWQKV